MKLSTHLPLLVYGVAITMIIQPGRAETLAFDPFAIGSDPFVGGYAIGSIAGQNPTVVGFSVAWANASVNATATGLTYSDANYHPASGGALQHVTAGRPHRGMDPALAAAFAGDGTVYWTFLAQSTLDGNGWNYTALEVGSGADADASKALAIGVDGGANTLNNFMYQINNGDKVPLGTTIRDTGTHLFLVRFDMSTAAASDSITMWIDPDLSGGVASDPPDGITVGGLDLLVINNLRFGAGGPNNFVDEIRFGTTLESVLDGPEQPPAPAFLSHPENQSDFVGSTILLTASAPADPEPDYQWEYSQDGFDGWENVGETNLPILEIPNAPFTANGYYRVTATNSNGSDTSLVAQVELVFPPPAITRQPLSAFVQQGSTIELSVEASGLGTLTYQWFKGFGVLDEETSATLVIENIDEEDVAEYFVEIYDDAAEEFGEFPTSIISNIVEVGINEDPLLGSDSVLIGTEPANGQYVVGPVAGQAPVINGFTGAWINGGVDATATGLTYVAPNYGGARGGAITKSGPPRSYRTMTGPLLSAFSGGGTVYWSFLAKFGTAEDNSAWGGYAAVEVGSNGDNDNAKAFAIGIDESQVPGEFMYQINNGAKLSLGAPSDTGTHLFLVRFDLSVSAASDAVTMWVDPDLSGGLATDPPGGVVVSGQDLFAINNMRFGTGGNNNIADEFRFGTTLTSVIASDLPLQTFASWIAQFPGVGAENGFGDDADGDGLANGLESFLGTNPGVSNPGLMEVAVNEGTLTFKHSINQDPPSDVIAPYLWSLDLVTWHADGATSDGTTVSFEPTSNTPTAGMTTVVTTVVGTPRPSLFVRLAAKSATP